MGILEVVHFIDHAHGTVDERIGTEGTCPFAQAQAEVEQGMGIHEFKQPLVPAFVTTMAEDGIAEHFRIET